MRYLDVIGALAVNVDTKTASLDTIHTFAVMRLTPENISLFICCIIPGESGKFKSSACQLMAEISQKNAYCQEKFVNEGCP